MSRRSSLVDAQELTYYCKACRAENIMDLPHWHWGQVCVRRQPIRMLRMLLIVSRSAVSGRPAQWLHLW